MTKQSIFDLIAASHIGNTEYIPAPERSTYKDKKRIVQVVPESLAVVDISGLAELSEEDLEDEISILLKCGLITCKNI